MEMITSNDVQNDNDINILPIYSIALILLFHLPNEIARFRAKAGKRQCQCMGRMLFFSGNICYCDYVNAFSAI